MIQGVGTDIIEVSRIQKAIERWGNNFLEHVFTPQEIAYAQKHAFPYPHYAGRFAAKEAIFKALGDPQIIWQDLNITNDAQGKPLCQVSKPIAPARIFLSISHCKEYATAVAVVEI